MNTDKLMELVDELRESITDYGDHGESIRNEVMADLLKQTDRIAAALRAEQAVGDVPDEWTEATKISMHDDVDDVLRDFAADPTGDNGVMVVREVMRVLRALGNARQSEGMVWVPREFMQGFHALAHNWSLPAIPPEHYEGRVGDAFTEAYRRCGKDLAKLRDLLTAAPGGEGEVGRG